MTRRVRIDHGLASLDLVLIKIFEAGAADLGRIRNEVAVHGADVFVARDGVEARLIWLWVEVDGCLVAQGAEPLVGHPLDEGVVAGEVYLPEGHSGVGHLLLLTQFSKRMSRSEGGIRLQASAIET